MSNCQRQKAPPLYIFIVVIPDGATSSPLYITRCNALLFLSRAIFGKPLAYAPLLYRFFLYFYYYYLFHKKLNNSLFPKPKTFKKKKPETGRFLILTFCIAPTIFIIQGDSHDFLKTISCIW